MVPEHVQYPMEETYTHNVGVIQRGIKRRMSNKISDLSGGAGASCHASVSDFAKKKEPVHKSGLLP